MTTTTALHETDTYSFERKKRLASKISEVRDKTILRQIKNIIFEENPDAIAKKSSGGYLMFFQNYAINTYIRLEELLSKIEIERLQRQTKSIAKASESLINSDDPTNDYETTRSRLRYSNREKRLMKRQQYEMLISKQVHEHLGESTLVTVSSPLTESANDSDQNTSDDDMENKNVTIQKTNYSNANTQNKKTHSISKKTLSASTTQIKPVSPTITPTIPPTNISKKKTPLTHTKASNNGHINTNIFTKIK